MTWTRVATAAVLIPFVVGMVLWGSTAWVALALALIILLALFEYFALGDAIGHRAYRFWTATCALILVYVQWVSAVEPTYQLAGGLWLHRQVGRFAEGLAHVSDAFFIFVVGVAVLTVWTKRPLVEGLPAAGISASGLLLVAFPLTFAVRLHAIGQEGPRLLLFALVITWVGDTVAYFVGRGLGKHPPSESQENLGRVRGEPCGLFASGSGFHAVAERAAAASAGDGRNGKYCRTSRRSFGIRLQTQRGRERLRGIASGARGNSGSHRCADSGDSGCLVLLDVGLLARDVGRTRLHSAA